MLICPNCESKMNLKTNKETKEQFLGCSNFPKCKYSTSYIDIYENEKIIRNIIEIFEDNLRKTLKIPYFLFVSYKFKCDMKYPAICTPKSATEYTITWNVELKRNTLIKILMELAHEYRHIYQVYFNIFDKNYDTTKKWRERPEEKDANKFMYEYINKIILNYKF